ncbi:DUF1389 domain-containing protein [Chlamydia vaughanii]|uniref:DUF1389 domain-containing protein n=1 Tax=Chlamydia vaughanii TaxID=3112552 RepID=UPI0032B25AB4
MISIADPIHEKTVVYPTFTESAKYILHRHAFTIASVILATLAVVLAVVLTSVVAAALLPPVAIAGAVFSVIFAGILSVYAVLRYLRPPMPRGFLSVLQKVYPEVIAKLCFEKSLTIQELRCVLSGLSSGVFDFPSESCKNKVESFGLERLTAACQDVEMPELDDVLRKHCIWYFIKEFIELGFKDVAEAEESPPRLYWVARLKLLTSTAFHELSWMFAQCVTREEYQKLCEHAQASTWNQAKELLQDLQPRMLACIDTIDPRFKKKNLIELVGSIASSVFPDTQIKLLCESQVNWDQLQLIKQGDPYFLAFLAWLGLGGPDWLARSSFVLSPHINENDPENYDHNAALLTCGEWLEYVQTRREGEWDSHRVMMDLLNKTGAERVFPSIPFNPRG